MKLLYKSSDGLIHECRSSQLFPDDKNSVVVWTKCEIDVPDNKSFTSKEIVTCPECRQI